METALAELIKKFPEYNRNEKWENVPITERKKIEQWSFNQCVEKPVLISMTSGTTGKPLTLLHSRPSMEAKIARARELFEGLFIDSHVFFNLLGRFCITKKTAELAFYSIQKLCISFGIPSPKNAQAITMAVQMRQPDGLIATTGGLASLLDLGIRITTRYALVGGSLAPEAFRKRIITSLQCIYIDTYACNEFGMIAADITGNRELVVGGGLFLEIQKSDNTITEEGTGNLLITDYTNYSMPFIRYLIGDKVELRKNNGKTTIRIIGRSDQLMNFDQTLVSIPHLIDSVKMLLGHERFYISVKNNEQNLYDEVKVHITAEDAGKERLLTEEIYRILSRNPKVIVTEKFFQAPNGKFINFFDLRKSPGAHW